MKLFLSLLIFFIGVNSCFAQKGKDSLLPIKDSSIKKAVIKKTPPATPATSAAKADSSKKRSSDSAKPRVAPLVRPTTVLTVKKDSLTTRVADTSKAPITPPSNPVGVVAAKPDSLVKNNVDTIRSRTAAMNVQKPDIYKIVLSQHPYFNFLGKPRYETTTKRADTGKDGLFYLLTVLVLYFALVRLLFNKYLSNLFAVFFRVSLKQKQIREQLLQSPLPSLLLNIFFIIAGGIYVSFLLRYYNFVSATNLWFLILYSIIALAVVYLVKFLILKLLGWMFNINEATDTYIFVIFLVNKLMGILLVPFLVLLAFSSIQLSTILVTLSFTMVAILFAYRYIISYAPVRKEIKVSQFHFFLYLCAFEIIPLLLIYKVLLTFLERYS